MQGHGPQSPAQKIQEVTEINLENYRFSPLEQLYADRANQMSVSELLRSYDLHAAVVPESLREQFPERTEVLGQLLIYGATQIREMLDVNGPNCDKLKSLDDSTLSSLAQGLGINDLQLSYFGALPKEQRAQYLQAAMKTQLMNPDFVLGVMAALADSNDPVLNRDNRDQLELMRGMVPVALTDLHLLRLMTMETLVAQDRRPSRDTPDVPGEPGGPERPELPRQPTEDESAGRRKIAQPDTSPPQLAYEELAKEQAEKLLELLERGKLQHGPVQVVVTEAGLSFKRGEVQATQSGLNLLLNQAREARSEEGSLRWAGNPQASAVQFQAANLEGQARDREWLLDALNHALKRMENAANEKTAGWERN